MNDLSKMTDAELLAAIKAEQDAVSGLSDEELLAELQASQPATVPLEGGRAPREAAESGAQMAAGEKEADIGRRTRAMKRSGQGGLSGSVVRGGSLGWSDEILAGASSLIDYPLQKMGIGPATEDLSLAETYERNREAARRAQDDYAAANPVKAGIANVVGGLMVGGPRMGPSGAIMPVGAPTTVAGMGKLGGTVGAVQGVGEAEGDLADQATSGVIGGVLGGVLGAGSQKVIDAVAARAAARMATPAAPVANEIVEAGGRMGVPVPNALATDSTLLRSGAQTARNIPGAGEFMDDAVKTFRTDMDTAATRVGNMASSSGVLKDRVAIGEGLKKAAMATSDDLDDKADEAYKVLRAAIHPDKPVDVTAKVAPLLDSIMKRRAAAGEGELGGYLTVAADLMTRPGGVTFNGLQRARSQLGKAIDWDEARGGMSVGDLKLLYGDMTEALKLAARKASKNQKRGNRAVNLLVDADKRYQETADITRSLSRDLGDNVPAERAVDKILTMASDASGGNIEKLRALKQAVGGNNFKDLSGYLIDRMGRNKASEFSGPIFVTNLEKMSPAAKREIFADPKIAAAVEDLRKLSEAFKRSDAFTNTSQTGRTTGALALGAAVWADPLTGIASALGARTFAKMMSKPATAQSLGQWAKTTAKLQGGLEKGTIGSARAFEKMSKVYAGKIAAEMGVPANDVARALMGSVKSAAEGEQEKRAQ
jgi:hypothetical protein